MTLVRTPIRSAWWRTRVLPIAVLAVVVEVAWTICLVQGGPGVAPFSSESWQRLLAFVDRVAGSGAGLVSSAAWRSAAGLAVDTLVMSVVAAGMAGIGVVATLPFAIRRRRSRPNSGFLRSMPSAALRLGYTLTRGVPELVWAFLVVFVLHPGLVAGAVALAIHNFGVLGRLAVDMAENTDRRPVAALEAAGASPSQVFAYGVLPLVLPGLVTFLLFRWEVIIRTTIVVGFVVGSGLGYQLRLDLSFFRYREVVVLLLTYLFVVLAADGVASALRRLAR